MWFQENIKKFINESIPVAVSFYSSDGYGYPTPLGAHIRVALAYDEGILFSEPDYPFLTTVSLYKYYPFNEFDYWLNKDKHCLIIKKQEH